MWLSTRVVVPHGSGTVIVIGTVCGVDKMVLSNSDSASWIHGCKTFCDTRIRKDHDHTILMDSGIVILATIVVGFFSSGTIW